MKQMDTTSAALRQSLVFDAVRDVAAIIGRQDGSGKVMHAKEWIPLLRGQCTSRSDFASTLGSLEGEHLCGIASDHTNICYRRRRILRSECANALGCVC